MSPAPADQAPVPAPGESMRDAAAGVDHTNRRVLRVARLAKTLMATAPFYESGLPMEHRPFDAEGHEELAAAVAFLAANTAGDARCRVFPGVAALHQLSPEELHVAAPRLVVRAWRLLLDEGPAAEHEWHRSLAMQIECIADTVPEPA